MTPSAGSLPCWHIRHEFIFTKACAEFHSQKSASKPCNAPGSSSHGNFVASGLHSDSLKAAGDVGHNRGLCEQSRRYTSALVCSVFTRGHHFLQSPACKSMQFRKTVRTALHAIKDSFHLLRSVLMAVVIGRLISKAPKHVHDPVCLAKSLHGSPLVS